MAKLTGLEAIESQKVFLKFFGIWPFQQETLFYKCRYYLTCAICFGFTAIPAIEMSNHLNDYKILSELVSVLVSPLVFCLKIISFKNSKAYLSQLLHNLEELPVDAREVQMLNALKLSKRLVIAYPTWNFLAVVVFLAKPLLEHNNLEQNLPVKFSHNLRDYKHLMYVYQILSLGIVSVGLAFFDSLTINLLNVGLSKLEILTKKIKNTSNLPKRMVAKEFADIVNIHNGLIMYIRHLEQVFTYCFFAQFFNSIVAICSIGLQLVHVDIQTVEFTAMFMYFFAMLIELVLYSWFGNEVIVKSQKILQACYECSWYEFDISTRKTIFIIMERSKKPLKLTALKFATLSLQTFAGVIRSSYSFFTVMQRVYLKSNGGIQ